MMRKAAEVLRLGDFTTDVRVIPITALAILIGVMASYISRGRC